jgi:DNA-binding SARP family transcriptional activator/tetratricopeptide (TPR) repeat protein
MLHVTLLGEQSIIDVATGTARTRSSRTIALVTYLVLHAGSPQSRQRIAGMFWPDSSDSQALTNLRRELHSLRHILGEERCVLVTQTDLCWRDTPTARVDVRLFDLERRAALAAEAAEDADSALRHADAALAEYQGELLPGNYDDWLLEARSELQQQCVELCGLICQTRIRRGELTRALDAARRRIQLQPLDEVGYRVLMGLHADLGDRASAISTYHNCASVLERELGVLPDQSTRAVLQRLMANQQPADTPRASSEPAAGRSGLAAGRAGLAAAQLVGRAAELAALHEVWRTAADGRPSMAIVRGGAGVGKTRLLAEIAHLARRQGAVVASSQCFGTSGRLALAPIADWLRNPAFRSATGMLDSVWRDEVDRLVPSDPARGDPTPSSRAMVDAWQRHRFFEGVTRALLGVDRPTLLVLDNLQWCDQETLAFLTFYLGYSPEAPVLVAGTLRIDQQDPEPELADWTVRMRATGMLTELSLSPLEMADTACLAEAIRGRPLLDDDQSLLQAATGGFPLHIVEAVRTVADLGSTPLPGGDLAAVLRSRLSQTTPAAQEVAGLAAAVGRDFTLDLLAEASDLDADSVVRAVDELWRRRIVHERGTSYDFSHDLLRDSAYDQVSPPKRWLLHRRLAQSLELLHANDLGPVSAQLAEQYARGGRPDRAVAYYRQAADLASRMFAHAEATRMHNEALSIVRAGPTGRDADRQELAVLEAMAAPLNARYGYSSRELQSVLERSIVLAESLGRTESVLNGLVGLWTSQFVQGRIADGHQTAARAVAVAEPGTESSGSAHFAFGGSSVNLGSPAEALRHFEIAAALAGSESLTIGTRPDVHTRAWAAHAHWLLGHDELALSSCRDAVRMARSAVDQPYSLAVALAYAGITHQMRADQAELRRAVTELRELCDRHGFGYYREWGLVLDGWCRGDESGVQLARRGIDNLKSDGSFARMPYWLALLADLLVRTGQPDAARSTLDAASVGGWARYDLWWLPEVMRLRAAHDTDPDQAVSRLRSAARLAAGHGSVALLRRCEHDLAERGVRPEPPDVRPEPPDVRPDASAEPVSRTLGERHGS